MNAEEIKAAQGNLDAMNAEDKRLRNRIESLELGIAEKDGRLRVIQAEFAEISRRFQKDLETVRLDRDSMERERHLLVQRRKANKESYGVLFEQVGRAERALAAEAQQANESE